MANSVDPDQTAPSGAVWSGFALFAYVILSESLVFEFFGHLPYPFELHQRRYAFIKNVDKKYTDCNLKTTELLDCALIGVYVVIRLNMVSMVKNCDVQIFRINTPQPL